GAEAVDHEVPHVDSEIGLGVATRAVDALGVLRDATVDIRHDDDGRNAVVGVGPLVGGDVGQPAPGPVFRGTGAAVHEHDDGQLAGCVAGPGGRQVDLG